MTRPWDEARIAEVRALIEHGATPQTGNIGYVLSIIRDALDEIERLRASLSAADEDDPLREEIADLLRERDGLHELLRRAHEQVENAGDYALAAEIAGIVFAPDPTA